MVELDLSLRRNHSLTIQIRHGSTENYKKLELVKDNQEKLKLEAEHLRQENCLETYADGPNGHGAGSLTAHVMAFHSLGYIDGKYSPPNSFLDKVPAEIEIFIALNKLLHFANPKDKNILYEIFDCYLMAIREDQRAINEVFQFIESRLDRDDVNLSLVLEILQYPLLQKVLKYYEFISLPKNKILMLDDIIDCYPKCQGIGNFRKFIEETPDYITVFEVLRNMELLMPLESILLADNNYINPTYILNQPNTLKNLQKKLVQAKTMPLKNVEKRKGWITHLTSDLCEQLFIEQPVKLAAIWQRVGLEETFIEMFPLRRISGTQTYPL